MPGYEMRIVLDLPPGSLSPNGRSHHMAKAKAVKVYRLKAANEAWAARLESGLAKGLFTDGSVEVFWYHKTNRFPDRDNIIGSLKSAFDGFTDAQLWDDDNGITFLPVVREKDKDRPRVELLLRSRGLADELPRCDVSLCSLGESGEIRLKFDSFEDAEKAFYEMRQSGSVIAGSDERLNSNVGDEKADHCY